MLDPLIPYQHHQPEAGAKHSEDLHWIQQRISEYGRQIDDWINAIRACPLIDGKKIDVTLTIGHNFVEHGLNRQPTGWIVIDTASVNPIIRTAWDETKITLYCYSAAGAVSLWIF